MGADPSSAQRHVPPVPRSSVKPQLAPADSSFDNADQPGGVDAYMLRIILVAALLVSALALAKQNHWFEKTGIVGTCAGLAAPRGDDGQWWSCEQGVLTGFPTLKRDSCESRAVAAGRQVWRCSTPLVTTPGGIL